MFTLNNFVNSIYDVPTDWIFEHYLDLPERLTGQHVKMQSLFNPDERTPSMHLHCFSNNKYFFKCFSTGNSGSPVDLMMKLWNVDFKTAAGVIIDDYKSYIRTGKQVVKKTFVVSSWRVEDYDVRKWTELDAKYWLQYNIGSKMLKKYNVIPIQNYTMAKYIGDTKTNEEFTVSARYIYAYTNELEEIYKIYQPKKLEKKFMKLMDYIQGSDQIEGKRFLVITSSLKDIMAIKSIPGLDIDVIAPDSENSKLSAEMITQVKQDYEAVITYMDSDKAGIDSMKFYYDKYNLPFVYLDLEKDFSDIVKNHGIKKAAYLLIPALDKAIAKYKILHEHDVVQDDLVY